jgi:hypothetical protein
MVKKDDWRLTNQEKYLKGVKLKFHKYSPYSKTWTHDHCNFCFKELYTEAYNPDVDTEGYSTEDNYHWICKECFKDFKDMFEWEVV